MGARCFLAESRTLSLEKGKATARIAEVISIKSPISASEVERSAPKWQKIEAYDHFFYRTDPPVDLSYLLPLQILASVDIGKSARKNRIHPSPHSLFFLNEKWAPARLGALFPESLVSAETTKLMEFIHRESKVVLKPLFQAQSKGVAVLEKSHPDLEKILKTATEQGSIPVILQRYLPGILDGETRLWFVQGKLMAAVRKVPKKGESIIDMDAGGSLEVAKLTSAEKKATLQIGGLLREEKILWAAVDLIDGKITDFNHTSPGLLVAMEKLLNKNLARLALKPLLGP